MENSRLLIAAFLSALVLIVWTYLFPQPPPTVREAPAEGALPAAELATYEEEGEGSLGGSNEAAAPGGMLTETSAVETLEAERLPEIVAEREERIVLQQEQTTLELSNRGGQLISLKIESNDTSVDVVRGRGADPYPFALTFRDGTPHPLNDALFTVEERTTEEGDPEVELRHRSELGDATKRFRWLRNGMIEVEVAVQGGRGWGLMLGPGVRNEDAQGGNRWLQPQASYRQGGESTTIDPKKIREDKAVSGTGLQWIALEDNYFLSAAAPLGGLREAIVRPILQRAEVVAGEPRFLPPGAGGDDELSPEQSLLLLADGPSMKLHTFFGAKEYARLSSLPYGLEESVRWGFFGILVRPLYHGLRWIYSNVVANWGWAIILMTVIIKLIFTPLTHKSQESMRKMQELNPKVQAVRGKFRSKLKDKQGRPNVEAQRQMNEEMMAVYKNAGVSPASGCFPMLLQLPVFFAFFKLLSLAVELRGAPWLGWIQDLSAPDPFYILPILMGVTSILMQKMTPASPDPMQRRMMQLMPIMFTFFALTFASGLVLYWVTNNILTMVHQGITMKHRQRQEAAAG